MTLDQLLRYLVSDFNHVLFLLSHWANYMLSWLGPRIWRFSVRDLGTVLKVPAKELASGPLTKRVMAMALSRN